ncbi:unnamed protein product [Lupinus luteus]|uniref:Uncharacterized protein n=1 Tax=Lupinus luteus TaxID=3873 RepID=A0AAV1XVK2_LUPLU
MEFISLQGKDNFFERRVGDYQKASTMSSLEDSEKNFFSSLMRTSRLVVQTLRRF